MRLLALVLGALALSACQSSGSVNLNVQRGATLIISGDLTTHGGMVNGHTISPEVDIRAGLPGMLPDMLEAAEIE
jgi:hypothetical protein